MFDLFGLIFTESLYKLFWGLTLFLIFVQSKMADLYMVIKLYQMLFMRYSTYSFSVHSFQETQLWVTVYVAFEDSNPAQE